MLTIDKMFSYKYLTKQHLKGLSKYKYSAIDTSPLSKYVMHPAWNTIVNFIPKFVAPNLLTFLGFLCMVIVVALMYYYDYNLKAGLDGSDEIPKAVLMICGLLVFLAYNLDGVDGKQARRLGVSGPLGELFDHGLDSYIVFLIPYSLLSIFGRDPQYSLSCFRAFLIVMSVVLNFYISHFEKYNTGTLYLPWGYDVSMWVSSFLFIIAGIYGTSIFKQYIFGVTFAAIFEVVVHSVGLITTLPVVLYNIYLSYKNRTGRKLSWYEAIHPLWSIWAITGTMIYWAYYSPNDVIEYDPRAFIFLYGTLFSNVASRLIISEMTHQRCDFVSWTMWPLLTGVLPSLFIPVCEIPVLYCLLISAVMMHVHYGVCVVRQICDHLKISCFIVPNKIVRKNKK